MRGLGRWHQTSSLNYKAMKTIIIKVESAEPYTRQMFKATLESWDCGIPIGYGDSIQEAIEIFLEAWEMKFDETPNYKWI